MARPRIYPTAADRRTLFRQDRRPHFQQDFADHPATLEGGHFSISAGGDFSLDKNSLAALRSSPRMLTDEYHIRLDLLQDSEHAARRRETVEQFEAAADLRADIRPPRGFGRDPATRSRREGIP